MEKTAKAGRKVTGEWEYKSTRSLPSEMTHVQADPALGRNTDWQQEWLSPSWPGCSLFNFKGALGREQGDTSNPAALAPAAAIPSCAAAQPGGLSVHSAVCSIPGTISGLGAAPGSPTCVPVPCAANGARPAAESTAPLCSSTPDS